MRLTLTGKVLLDADALEQRHGKGQPFLHHSYVVRHLSYVIKAALSLVAILAVVALPLSLAYPWCSQKEKVAIAQERPANASLRQRKLTRSLLHKS